MRIAYADRGVERLAIDETAMLRKLGPSGARKLKRCINTLRAVDRASDLFALPGRWHVLNGDWKGHLSGDLDHPQRLVVRPQEPVMIDGDGGIDWAATTAVTVVGIFDTH